MRKTELSVLCLFLTCGCTARPTDRSDQSSLSCRRISYLDLSEPVVKTGKPVDDSWFADSLMIGDSRMVSLDLYSNLKDKNAEIYADESLGVYGFASVPLQLSGSTAWDVMLKSERKHIYYWLGLNELSYCDNDEWKNSYSDIVSATVQAHPDADIYLIGMLMPKSVSSLEGDELQQKVTAQNEEIQKIAEENGVYCIDLNSEMCGKDGIMKDSYLWGNYALNTRGAEKVAELLPYYTVNRENYEKEVCE